MTGGGELMEMSEEREEGSGGEGVKCSSHDLI